MPEMCVCGEYELVAVDCCDKMRCEGQTVIVLDGAGEPDVRVCREGVGCDARPVDAEWPYGAL